MRSIIGAVFLVQIVRAVSVFEPSNTSIKTAHPFIEEYFKPALGALNEDFASASTLLVHGQDIQSQELWISKAAVDSVPVILIDASAQEKQMAAQLMGLPMRHAGSGKSAIWMVDFVYDTRGSRHLRLFHLPAGELQNVTTSHVSPVSAEVKRDQGTLSDCAALDVDPSMGQEIVADIVNYLNVCGGSFVKDVSECWNLVESTAEDRQSLVMQQNEITAQHSETDMIPLEGAVWREMLETTYRFWMVKWGSPYPFEQDQKVSHRFNTYWYMYLQAPPFSQIYYAFMLVDGIHNPNNQKADMHAVGIYLSSLQMSLHAEREDGTTDPSNLFWIKSNPPTQNTQHTVGRSWESTDSYSLSMNLGFKGEVVHGDITFNYSHTFTASYKESRDITDWSVLENTDPIDSTGSWNYYQQWPVEMRSNSVDNFPGIWEQYFDQPWNPCVVKDVPNLSKYALTTHNSIVWGITPVLRRQRGNKMSLPIKFSLKFCPRLSAHACEVIF